MLLCFFCVFFIYITVDALSFPGEAKIFPLAIGGPGLILCLILLSQSVFRKNHQTPANRDVEDQDDDGGTRSWIGYGLGLVYLAIVWVFGYLIGTALIALLVPPLLGEQRKKALIVFSLSLILFVGVVFQWFLKVPLPTGVLF